MVLVGWQIIHDRFINMSTLGYKFASFIQQFVFSLFQDAYFFSIHNLKLSSLPLSARIFPLCPMLVRAICPFHPLFAIYVYIMQYYKRIFCLQSWDYVHTIYIYIYIFPSQFSGTNTYCSIVTDDCYVDNGFSSDGEGKTQKHKTSQVLGPPLLHSLRSFAELEKQKEMYNGHNARARFSSFFFLFFFWGGGGGFLFSFLEQEFSRIFGSFFFLLHVRKENEAESWN